MISWQNFAGCTAAAAMMIGLLSTAGCRQMSHQVRSEQPILEGASPTPPDYSSSPPIQLERVPPKRARVPELPPAPEYVPPPAPPTESAALKFVAPPVSSRDAWETEPVELVDQEDEEFFSKSTPAYPPSFVTERAELQAARLAAEGRAARQRKEIREPLWPVIIPGVSSLKPVAPLEPPLIPVPK